MDEGQFNEIKIKLDAIISLLAVDKLADKNKTEAIIFLNQIGLDNSLIAAVVDTKPSTVAVRISEYKKKDK